MKMTMKEFRDLCKTSFEAAIEAIQDTSDDIHSDEEMRWLAKVAIDTNNLALAIYLCQEILDKEVSENSFYKYDVTSGTGLVTVINNGEDLYLAYADYCSDYTLGCEIPEYSEY